MEKQQERRRCIPAKKGRDNVIPAFLAWLLQMPLFFEVNFRTVVAKAPHERCTRIREAKRS
jgi:hypothetical protein